MLVLIKKTFVSVAMYQYLYFCFYNLVVKRKGDISYERAAALLSLCNSLLCTGLFIHFSIWFDITFLFGKSYIAIIGFGFFLINAVIHGRYFKKK